MFANYRLFISRPRRRHIWLPTIVAALLTLVACGGSPATSNPAAGDRTLTIGLNAGPTTLDPAKDGTNNYLIVRPLTNAALIHMNPDGSFSPGLATQWRYLGTGNTDFELTLRQDARFSDGSPVNAAAVKTWLDYFAKANGPNLSFMGTIRSVDTVGDWTVQIHLASPNPIIPWTLSDQNNWGALSSPAAVADPGTLGSRTVGAGPYMLDPTDTVAGDHYTYVPNPYYHDKSAVHFNKIIAKIIPTPSSLVQAINSGQVDVAVGDPSTARAASPRVVDIVHAPTAQWLLALDNGGVLAKPLADPRVRQALNYAIDRPAIVKAIVGEYGSPTAEIGSSDGYDPAYSDHYPYDPAKAKALLAEAGYPQGFSATILVQGAAGNLGRPLVQATVKYFNDIGVQLTLDTAGTQAEWTQKLQANTTYPILHAGLVPTRSMWLQYGLYLKAKGIYNKLGTWSDPTVDQLWNTGQVAADPGPSWQQISRRATDQAYFVPILFADSIFYVAKHIKGVTPTAHRQVPIATEWTAQ